MNRRRGARCLRILGIESSCDDTAAAVVEGCVGRAGAAPPGRVVADVRMDQDGLHRAFGGVVPEIAARAHAERVDLAAEAALRVSGSSLGDLDGIAVTAGPGLAPGLLAGVMTARGLAAGSGVPLYAVNHLEAHALTVRLEAPVAFPYLLLLASGGHCLFAAVLGPLRHRVYGATLDDAPGEAFDKVARELGLGFPGGPELERVAARGAGARFALPRPLLGRPGCALSFSGLKTAARRAWKTAAEERSVDRDQLRADLAASFQAAVVETMVGRTEAAMDMFRSDHPDHPDPVLAGAGGVLANRALRPELANAAAANGFQAVFPDPALCTDNGAMVAWAGIEQIGAGAEACRDFPIRARWPLDQLSGKAR